MSAVADSTEILRRDHRTPSVRKRMTEFLGRLALREATAVYVVANDGYSDFASLLSPRCLLKHLEAGWDVERFWILLAFTVAVRHALDYRSTLRAVVVCLAGWLLYAGMFFGLVSRA